MNRGDYILQELRAVVDDETTFSVVPYLKEQTQNRTDKITVYLYIIKEVLTNSTENHYDRFYSVDVGVRLSQQIKDGETGVGAAWRNDAIHKLESKLYGFATHSTTASGVTYILSGVRIVEAGGYFDNKRTNADADAA